MYETFYHLSADPFRLSPDPTFCFEHASFARARKYMQYALRRGEGFIMVTGRAGTGKTTLVEALIGGLPGGSTVAARLVSAQLGPEDLLRRVAFAFGLEVEGLDKATLLQRLERFFIHQAHRGRSALLVIDEAQGLALEALEELRLLTNLQEHARPLLQIFLVGQEHLHDLVLRPEMEQFHQRLIAACHLHALELEEVRGYVEHRLARAGWHGDPRITADAYVLMHRVSAGVARRLNQLCSRLLLYGATEDRHRLDGRDVLTVTEDLRGELLTRTDLPDADELEGLLAPAPAGPPETTSWSRRATPSPPAAAPDGDEAPPARPPPPADAPAERSADAADTPSGVPPPPASEPAAAPSAGSQAEAPVNGSGAILSLRADRIVPHGRPWIPGARPRRRPLRRALALALLLVGAASAAHLLWPRGYVVIDEVVQARLAPAYESLSASLGAQAALENWRDRLLALLESTRLAQPPAPAWAPGESRTDVPIIGAITRTGERGEPAERESVSLDSPGAPSDATLTGARQDPPASPSGPPAVEPGTAEAPSDQEPRSATPSPAPVEDGDNTAVATAPLRPSPEPASPLPPPASLFPPAPVTLLPARAPNGPGDLAAFRLPHPVAIIATVLPPREEAAPARPAGRSTPPASDPLAHELLRLGLGLQPGSDGSVRVNLRRQVPFEVNSAAIRVESRLFLNRLAEVLVRHPGYDLAVTGHTDESGTPEHNAALARRRAESVVTYLRQRGVPAERLDLGERALAGEAEGPITSPAELRRIDLHITRRAGDRV
jgi:type II secretory pathway predicted ATPase ExeA/outer membrane protein OmpA-like peptidoglycan-associated protein